MVLTSSSGLEEFSASQELLQFSNLLYVATLVCFAEAFHWPPVVSQRNCSKYRCTFGVFLGGSKFSVLLHCYLRPPLIMLHFFPFKNLIQSCAASQCFGQQWTTYTVVVP